MTTPAQPYATNGDTPRTDGHGFVRHFLHHGLEAEFIEQSRQLERELHSAIESGAALVEDIDGYRREIARLTENMEGLRDAKNDAAALLARSERGEPRPHGRHDDPPNEFRTHQRSAPSATRDNFAVARDALAALTDQDRDILFGTYCRFCGGTEKPCYCMRDD